MDPNPPAWRFVPVPQKSGITSEHDTRTMMKQSMPEARPLDVKRPATEFWCYTHATVEKSRYVWSINNFSFLNEDLTNGLKSTTFSAGANDGFKWCLEIVSSLVHNFLCVYLKLESSNKPEVLAKFKISILNAKQEETEVTFSSKVYKYTQGRAYGTDRFIRRDVLLSEENKLLPGDKLTILCNLSFVSDTAQISGQAQFKVPECNLSDDLGTLFENKTLSDVILSANGKELEAHKAILAARSPVFAAMFTHKMKEEKRNSVEITDVNYEVLSEMIRFIYTGKIDNLNKVDSELLAAADKYAVTRLKIMCEEALYKKLSIENAANILILADLHKADELKAQAIDFIIMHAAEVEGTEGWRLIQMSYSHIMSDFFRALVTQRNGPAAVLARKMQPKSRVVNQSMLQKNFYHATDRLLKQLNENE